MDFQSGVVDLHFNMAREVTEETGLDIAPAPRRRLSHYCARENAGTAIFRRYFLHGSADSIAASDQATSWPREADPEIEGPVIIRHAERSACRAGGRTCCR